MAGRLQAEFAEQKVIYLATDVTDRQNVRNSMRVVDVVVGNAGMFLESQPEMTIMANLVGRIMKELGRNLKGMRKEFRRNPKEL